jgi:hypothetical protein
MSGAPAGSPSPLTLAGAVGAAVQAPLVDGHHGLERPDEVERLGLGAAEDRGGHHRRRGLADRAALAVDLDVGDPALVVQVDVEDDLVAAERVESLDPPGRRGGQLAPVPRVAVVVEDDLPVEVFEAGHGQNLNRSAAATSASDRASTSASSL